MYGLPRPRHITQKLFSMGPQRLTRRRYREAPTDPREELHAQAILQRPHTRAYSRLADIQRRSCAVKSAVRQNGQKRFDLINFH